MQQTQYARPFGLKIIPKLKELTQPLYIWQKADFKKEFGSHVL